jgi:hypothetical protein
MKDNMDNSTEASPVVYVVRVDNTYLISKNGDVGYTSSLATAGRFPSREEAFDTAFVGCNLEEDEFEIFPARKINGVLSLLPISENGQA